MIYVECGCIAVLEPIILNTIFQNRYNVFNILIFFSCIGVLCLDILRNQTQHYVEAMEIYINKVLIQLEKYPRIVEAQNEEFVNIRWTKKKLAITIIMVIVGIAIIGLTILGEKILEQNEIIKKNSTIIIIICIFIYSVWNRLKKRKCIDEIEFVSAEYEMIKNEVTEICNMLNIKNVKFMIKEESAINAFSEINDYGIWEVSVTSNFIAKLLNMSQKMIIQKVIILERFF